MHGAGWEHFAERPAGTAIGAPDGPGAEASVRHVAEAGDLPRCAILPSHYTCTSLCRFGLLGLAPRRPPGRSCGAGPLPWDNRIGPVNRGPLAGPRASLHCFL